MSGDSGCVLHCSSLKEGCRPSLPTALLCPLLVTPSGCTDVHHTARVCSVGDLRWRHVLRGLLHRGTALPSSCPPFPDPPSGRAPILPLWRTLTAAIFSAETARLRVNLSPARLSPPWLLLFAALPSSGAEACLVCTGALHLSQVTRITILDNAGPLRDTGVSGCPRPLHFRAIADAVP